MKGLVGLILVGSALASAACGAGAAAEPASKVTAKLNDNSIAVSQASAGAGLVTFTIVNAGSVIHSVQLLKTDLPHDKIPGDPKDPSRAQAVGLLRDTGDIPPQGTKEFSAKLAAGSYVLVCNQPGHYLVGMHVAFTVT